MSDLDAITRIVVALVLGGLIGYEREVKGHAAGLRTNMLVCLGSALFMIVAECITLRFTHLNPPPDPSRIGSTIVTGVGFLGAGLIFQNRTQVLNLTTAATIWVIAAIGMLAGAGIFVVAASGTVITLGVLALLVPLEARINRRLSSSKSTEPKEAPADHAAPDDTSG